MVVILVNKQNLSPSGQSIDAIQEAHKEPPTSKEALHLEEVRKRINTINDDMLRLFLERMKVSKDVAMAKKAMHKPIYDPKRERDILNKVVHDAGPEFDTYAYRLFETLFSLSRSYQGEQLFQDTPFHHLIEEAMKSSPSVPPLRGKVGIAGEFGCNTQLAAEKIIPLGELSFLPSFEAVFDAVESGELDYGILPIENSTNGSVKDVYDLLVQKNCYILRATKIWICHSLLVKPGTSLDEIHTIYSHPQALGQCRRFITNLGPHVKVEPYTNTAEAAKFVASQDNPHMAAIAPPLCGDLYGLQSVAENIQNTDNNYTRFICIGRNLTIYPGSHKVSVLASVDHTPGGLGALLTQFSNANINLSKLESRPIEGRDFEFLFYLDLEASFADKRVISVLSELDASNRTFRFLGAYPEH